MTRNGCETIDLPILRRFFFFEYRAILTEWLSRESMDQYLLGILIGDRTGSVSGFKALDLDLFMTF